VKVLWFSNTAASGAEVLKFGGLGGGWLASLDKQIASKVELHVAFHYPKFAHSFVHLGVTYHPICHPQWKRTLLLSQFGIDQPVAQKVQSYLALIEQVKPDVIHIHGTENEFGLIQAQVSIPVVTSIQGNITVYQYKYSQGLGERLVSKRWFKPRGWFVPAWFPSFVDGLKKFDRMKSVEQASLAQAKWIMGRTAWDRRITKILAPGARYIQSEEMLRPVFYQESWNAPPSVQAPVIHSTTGGNAYKGFETIAESLELLLKWNNKVVWQVAGLNENDLLVAAVRKKMGHRYPAKSIRFLGGLNATSLVNALQQAHLYVMPSHIENSPNNLCEAMILGMPAVATFAGGTASLLEDGKEGCLVQSGDPWAMAGTIIELLEDYQTACGMGKQARKRALMRHDPEAISQQLLAAYDLLKSNGSSHSN